ncbi:MAG: DUF2946 family protein [Burkholderiales bacterium]
MKRGAAAWLAILSMTLNASWPVLAGANPGIADPFGTEVCTASGVVAVADSGLQLPNPGGPSHRLVPHCAYCTLGAAHSALHSASPPAVDAVRLHADAPAVYRFALPPWFFFASLRSRSPPA